MKDNVLRPLNQLDIPHVEVQPLAPLAAPLPSLFDPSNYSGQKQGEILYSEQQPGQLGGGEEGGHHNMTYHQICGLNTTSVIYPAPANINTETGEAVQYVLSVSL